MKIQTEKLENLVIYTSCILLLISLMILGNITAFQFKITYFLKQCMWIAIAAPFFWIFYKKINLQKVRPLAFPFVILGLFLLAAVFVPGVGIESNYSKRWIDLIVLNLQASTVARVILIFYLVHYFVKNEDQVADSTPTRFIQNYFPVLVITFAYILLIFIEPDLSTSAILFLIFFVVLFLANISIKTILIIGLIAVILLGSIFILGATYRKERLLSFIHFISGKDISPEIEERFYQPRQALIALSQGKYTGKGTIDDRAKLFYLPFAKTDYIFSVIGEEFGFFGAVTLIIIYLTLIISCFTLALRNPSFFHSLLIMALSLNILFNLIVNISVVTSLIPSTGVSLPFISYGGSATIMDVISIGIILNASKNGRKNFTKTRFQYA
ncbi:MAG: FtsW/RodA/SpoVE family cell cycle protein [Candidatus Cloacimonadota bacterium]|nr:FtsW/RodA/SpoVE family cell cycle protein [Candidatus Cloacimonadota bacterium]